MQNDVYFFTTLPDGSPCVISMPGSTVKRLAFTCFRGKRLSRAGNFSSWYSFREVMKDNVILQQLKAHVMNEIDISDDFPRNIPHRLQIQHPTKVVGWSSTTPYESVNKRVDATFENFKPNHHSSAVRVKLNRTDIKAPRTHYVTIVYELEFKVGTGWKVVVGTIYPGKDIGRLHGNITKQQNIVFFDFNHPGK